MSGVRMTCLLTGQDMDPSDVLGPSWTAPNGMSMEDIFGGHATVTPVTQRPEIDPPEIAPPKEVE